MPTRTALAGLLRGAAIAGIRTGSDRPELEDHFTLTAVRYSAETVGLLLRMDGFSVQHVGRDNEVACGTADEPLGDDSPLAFGRRLDEATGLHRPQVVVRVLAG